MTDEILERQCASCGKDLLITVEENGDYDGGHYWGAMEIPTDDAEIIDRKTEERFGKEVEIVEWSEYKEVEYWECDECCDHESH